VLSSTAREYPRGMTHLNVLIQLIVMSLIARTVEALKQHARVSAVPES
jgi:hypothetical protein